MLACRVSWLLELSSHLNRYVRYVSSVRDAEMCGTSHYLRYVALMQHALRSGYRLRTGYAVRYQYLIDRYLADLGCPSSVLPFGTYGTQVGRLLAVRYCVCWFDTVPATRLTLSVKLPYGTVKLLDSYASRLRFGTGTDRPKPPAPLCECRGLFVDPHHFTTGRKTRVGRR